MKLSSENIRELARSLLFENNINELRLPLDHDMDAGKNNRTSAKDQPGPQIDGEGNYQKSYEDLEVEMPLSPSDVMPTFFDEKLSLSALEDKEYVPQNVSEFMRASNTLIDRNKEDIGKKELEKAWKTLTTIIKKAK
jgi:hypothetical protein